MGPLIGCSDFLASVLVLMLVKVVLVAQEQSNQYNMNPNTGGKQLNDLKGHFENQCCNKNGIQGLDIDRLKKKKNKMS